MAKFIDLTGKKFGKLTVVKRAPNKGRYTMWHCTCDCGNEGVFRGSSLTTGNNIGCGCGKIKHGHNMSSGASSEYRTWNSMLQRCENPKSRNYKNYGARGIKVCERWHTFENFLEDMGEKPSLRLSIDRIDVNGNYEPNNCRWATKSEQEFNKRLNSKNKTGVTGVYFEKYTNKYRACITVNSKDYRSERFETLEEAIQARKELEQKYWKSSI